jgi:hypothetical protein
VSIGPTPPAYDDEVIVTAERTVLGHPFLPVQKSD